MKQNRDPSVAERNFILQQGFPAPAAPAYHREFSALLFQPRLVGLTLLIGILFQSPAIFLGLAAVLWWSALLPKWNPFDRVYNLTAGAKPGAVRLRPAPGPRRFAQGMAGSFALGIGVALLLESRGFAYVLEALFVLASAALAFGRVCLGSFVYYVVTGRGEFARRTLPWSRH
jgi:Domain of unknown function (DUF4395)